MNTNQSNTRVKLLTIHQAAEVIEGLTEYRIRQLCRAGELPCLKAGRKYLINEQTLIDVVSTLGKHEGGQTNE